MTDTVERVVGPVAARSRRRHLACSCSPQGWWATSRGATAPGARPRAPRTEPAGSRRPQGTLQRSCRPPKIPANCIKILSVRHSPYSPWSARTTLVVPPGGRSLSVHDGSGGRDGDGRGAGGTHGDADTGEAIEQEIVNTVVDGEASVAPRRFFTIPGRDPFEEIEWELRDAHIPGKDGPAFEQREVEFPKFWSQTATNIVAQKYFRGRMASPERERSGQGDDRPRRRHDRRLGP